MSGDKKYKQTQLEEGLKKLESLQPSTASIQRNEQKRIRRINPLGMRVVIKLVPDNCQTESGLYLPEGAKQEMAESLLGEVIEVASAMDDHSDEETNVSGVPLGALVLIKKDSGTTVPWDETLRIVETKDVLGVVHEVSIS